MDRFNMDLPKDEIKESVKWNKGCDFMDGSPRYTFEGRNPQDTYERFQVVIYTERERKFSHDPSSVKNFYYGFVRDNDKECADTIGPFGTVKEAKSETLKLFNEYMVLFAQEQSMSYLPSEARTQDTHQAGQQNMSM